MKETNCVCVHALNCYVIFCTWIVYFKYLLRFNYCVRFNACLLLVNFNLLCLNRILEHIMY